MVSRAPSSLLPFAVLGLQGIVFDGRNSQVGPRSRGDQSCHVPDPSWFQPHMYPTWNKFESGRVAAGTTGGLEILPAGRAFLVNSQSPSGPNCSSENGQAFDLDIVPTPRAKFVCTKTLLAVNPVEDGTPFCIPLRFGQKAKEEVDDLPDPHPLVARGWRGFQPGCHRESVLSSPNA